MKVPSSYIRRVSHGSVRRYCSTIRFSALTFLSQLRLLGHILRKPSTHPLRLVLFQLNTDLDPAALSNYDRVTKAVRGRPDLDWCQAY